MKILRLFDSLKFMRAMFVAIACVFILNVAHADTNAIQSVIAYGKTEQSATPTPTNPVPIMTNNGELKAGKNLFDDSLFDTATGTTIVYRSFSIPNGIYTMSTNFTALQHDGPKSNVFIFAGRVSSGANSSINGVYSTQPRTITVTDGYYTVAYRSAISTGSVDGNPKNFNWMLEKGSTATAYEPYGIYTNGLTETIRDAAGHKATTQMLLGLNDEYRDEQNINTGAITRRVGVKVLDGSENWAEKDQYKRSYITIDNLVASATVRTVPAYCNYFENVHNSEPIGNVTAGQFYVANARQLYFHISQATTADFKAWLAEQYAAGMPVIVVYPLATETTESVATQQMTTAPVRQTAGSILGMPIEVVLGDGTREWVSEMITIATTRYSEEQFKPVETRLDAAVAAVDTVVSQTMTQAQQIDQIATNKQTRPDEGCTAKYCLLVEDEDGTPHWYPIAGANGVAHALPAGYTELQYIESTGTQYINTGVVPTLTSGAHIRAKFLALKSRDNIIFGATDSTAFAGGSPFSIDVFKNQVLMPFGGDASNSPNYSPAISKTMETNVLYDFKLNYLNDKKASVNDTQVTYSNNPVTMTSRSLLLFNLNNSAGGMSQYAATQSQIFSAVITNGSNIEFNGVPAKRDSDGVIGVYDMVSGTFFTNAGTGTFTAGPDM